MSTARYLQIAGSNISGGIALEIGNSIQLHVLDLSSNHLVGKLPNEFGKLTTLLAFMLNGINILEIYLQSLDH